MDQLTLMQIFVAIAEKGSLAAVARARGQSPSAVTLALQRLEEIVGAQLVLRTTRKLHLTPEGERFLSNCRRILLEIDEAMDSVADNGPLRGELRVSAPSDFGRTRLTRLIDSFLRAYPNMRVELSLTDAVVDLADRSFDLAIRLGSPRDAAVKFRLIMRADRLVCAAPTYWDRYGRPNHPRDLHRHNCLILSREGAPTVTWSFRDGGRPLAVAVHGDRASTDGDVLRRWAIEGAGVAMKSEVDIAEDVSAGRLEPVLQQFCGEETNLYAVWPASRRLSRRVEAFVDHVASHLQPT